MKVFFQGVQEDRQKDGRMFYAAVGTRCATFAEASADAADLATRKSFVSLYREVDGYRAEWIADLDRESGVLLYATGHPQTT